MSSALLSYEEAANLVAAHTALLERSPAVECVQLSLARGRSLARPLLADRDQPPFTRASRDGFACRAVEARTHQWLTLAGSTRAGDAPAGPLPPGAAWEIMNGAPLPASADAVIAFDQVERAQEKIRMLTKQSTKPGKNVVSAGAQARAGDELLPAGTALGPAQIALAAACGAASLTLFARPLVAILTTGDELVPVGSAPTAGKIRNSNAPMLAAMIEAAGGAPWVLPAAADRADVLDAALAETAKADLLIVSGGTSAGKFDLVTPALARAGARFHFTGVQMQPGRPTVFGELKSALPFFALAGNPVSAALTFLLFVAPVLSALTGTSVPPRFVLARLAHATEKHGKAGYTRFLPALCDFGAPGGQLPTVELLPTHGSGDLLSLARSNCFLVAPVEEKRFEAGAIVRILLA